MSVLNHKYRRLSHRSSFMTSMYAVEIDEFIVTIGAFSRMTLSLEQHW